VQSYLRVVYNDGCLVYVHGSAACVGGVFVCLCVVDDACA